jgi:ABC-type multidrug transport system fused ATPase/permease subunit
VEYLELPQEPPVFAESSRPPAYWPSSESDNLVVVEDLVIKYAPELPQVLHDVSFTLRGGEHVGLLGRSGASILHKFLFPLYVGLPGSGKSTLAMSILRFVSDHSGMFFSIFAQRLHRSILPVEGFS